MGASDNELGSLSIDATTKPSDAPKDTVPPTWNAEKALEASAIDTTSLTLTWNGAEDNNNQLTGYKVLRDGVMLTDMLDKDTTSYNVSGLMDGTSYTFRVEARGLRRQLEQRRAGNKRYNSFRSRNESGSDREQYS